jgi:Ca2+-binding RTX toxin-like protein
MRATRIDNEYLYYLIFGSGYADNPWSHIWGRNDYSNDHWELFVRPTPSGADIGLVDMSNEAAPNISVVYTQSYKYNGSGELVYATDGGTADLRTADRLTLDHKNVGPESSFKLALQGVEFIDAPVDNLDTKLQIITKNGFETDGTLASLTMHVGRQEMTFTGAARDSTIFMGPGYDTIDFVDHLDVPGEQFWSVIRRPDGELDVYSLFSGYRVQLGGGYKGWTAAYSPLMNYGEVEKITLRNYKDDDEDVYLPGVDLPDAGDRGTTDNIDLRSDKQLSSDSFNLAYFNFIRYTSDNVWAGEATIHDGTPTGYSTPSDRTVTAEKYGVQAPNLTGTMSVIGSSRNGTHDLIVTEQTAQDIDGNLRLYAFDVDSGLYNDFNAVYLGTSADETSDKSSADGTAPSDRVALYGFGGNDTLIGGDGKDYIFGGKSSFNPLDASPTYGNFVVGGDGADYFGVGHTDASGAVQYVSPETGAVLESNDSIDISTSFGSTASLVQGTGTDRIGDWDAGTDTLVVLENGVAIIDNLKSLYDAESDLEDGSDSIDLRSYLATSTSDQNHSGARAGDGWDANEALTYIFQNQQVRDALAILNEVDPAMTADVAGLITNYTRAVFDETDVTVRNDGVIVSKGFDGDDTIYGSFGIDYIYGGSGDNLIWAGPTTGTDGADKIFVDGYFGSQEVRNFNVSEDQVYLNKEVLDWVRVGNGFGSEAANPYNKGDFQDLSEAGFLSGKDIDPNLAGALNIIFMPYKLTYKAILNDGNTAVGSNGAWSNKTHYFADDQASVAMIAAGSATVAAGLAMLTNPFTAIPGIALVATGTSQIVAGAITTPHQNAQITSEDRAIVTLLDNEVNLTSNLNSADKHALLDFFYATDPNDGFARALEFTVPIAGSDFGGSITSPFRPEDQSSPIVGYFAVQTDVETFIYRVASSDRIVTDDETYLVAEVSGLLDQQNLEAYLGSLDIYNAGLEAPDFAPKPILSVTTDPVLSGSGRTTDTTIDLSIVLDADLEVGETIKIYRDDTLIATLDLSNAVGGNPRAYEFEDDLASVVTSGEEEIFAYTTKAISKDGIARAGNNLAVTVDLEAPEIISVSAAGSNSVSVVVTAGDISSTEKAVVRLMEGSSEIDSSEVSTSGSAASLTIPPASGTTEAIRTFIVEAADARSNTVSHGTKIFALTTGGDGTNIAPFTILEAGAITFALGGDDYIDGTSGNDVLVLGVGTTRQEVDLKDGDDTLIMPSSVVSIVADGGDGRDTVDFSQITQALHINLSTSGFSFIVGGTPEPASILNFENVNGSQGDDTITGSSLANDLFGGGGNDVLRGEGGNDVLRGGSGNDQLTGGTGADTFVFEATANGLDTIVDFNRFEGDILDLSEIITGGEYNTAGAAIVDGSTAAIALADVNNKLVYFQVADVESANIDEASLFATGAEFAAEGTTAGIEFILVVGAASGTDGVKLYQVTDGAGVDDMAITQIALLQNNSLADILSANLDVS